MYNPKKVRKLTVGGIKDGFHWAEGSKYRIPHPDPSPDDEDNINVFISNIIRHDPTPDTAEYWDIFVKKVGSNEEFYWKRHVRGKESVTEEYYLEL